MPNSVLQLQDLLVGHVVSLKLRLGGAGLLHELQILLILHLAMHIEGHEHFWICSLLLAQSLILHHQYFDLLLSSQQFGAQKVIFLRS